VGVSPQLVRVLGDVHACVLEPGGPQLSLGPASTGPDHEGTAEGYLDRLLRRLVAVAAGA
jgi:hypothetical protein